MSTSSLTQPTGWGVLRQSDFLRFILARFMSALALQMVIVAVGWLVYDLTSSAFALGLVGLSIFLPTVALSLIAGHIADSHDRARVVAFSQALIAAVCLALYLFARSGTHDMLPAYGLMAVMGAARSFVNPANQALMPTLIPREQFSSAVAVNSSTWQCAVIAGPAAGGLLYAFGPEVVFAVAACLTAISAYLALSIARPRQHVSREPPTWASLVAGIHFIRANPAILGAISLDLFAVLLGGAASLMPIVARDILHTGPWGLGLLRSAPAIGAFAVSLLLAHYPIRRHVGERMFSAVAIFGVATIFFGLSSSLILSMLALIFMGAADMISVFLRQSLVQIDTPDAMRGRVAAVNTVFIGASNELGDFESGVVAAAIGAVPAVIIGGIGTILIAALWARLFPALRQRDEL
ncbi:MAG: MFS transporter [Ancalomicrobiaceae bacterium]|nr:MFS transporter [Ancalomicrobiaceae bacterium]